MKLTPLDIRHKEFARSMRGYRDIEVDEFLDDIADEFERLFNENIDFHERLDSLEEKNEQYRNIEETLKKTLVSAQQQAEELKHNAKKEADLILRDAELKARSILNDSYAERQKIQRSVQALKQRQEDLKYQMKSILESYLNQLDQEGEIDIDDAIEAEGGTVTAAEQDTAAAAASVDEAVSHELLMSEEERAARAQREAAIARFSDMPAPAPLTPPAGPAGEPQAAEATVETSRRDETPRPARPAADEEDPFADMDIDLDDSKFKW